MGEGLNNNTDKKPLTINLSSYHLSPHDISLLDKGLTFIPAPKILPVSTVIKDKMKLIRSIKLGYFFKNKPDHKLENKKLFVDKSSWIPPDELLPIEALDTIKNINNEFDSLLSNQKSFTRNNEQFIRLFEKSNLDPVEAVALNNLTRNPDLIIKPADKGGALVIMNRSDYIAEAERQLNDSKYYTKLLGPIHQNNVLKIMQILDNLRKKCFISPEQFLYLTGPQNYRERIFYLLPKIHKHPSTWTIPGRMPQGRPIVSDTNSESYRVSAFIDSFLKPLACKHPSYIKNTYDFINRIRDKEIPKSHLLVTGDVTSLYTNMDIDRTIECVQKLLTLEKGNTNRPDKEIIQLLEITMKNNDFAFNGDHYLQICGTAMGKIYAPSLANIYLMEFDQLARTGYKIHPDYFFRYLDDIFFTWGGTKTELKEYETYLNSLIPGIKISLDCSETSINFLDTKIYKKPVLNSPITTNLQTCVYFKPTATHQLLLKSSHHPRHTSKGILKSQLIRFKRISSSQNDFDKTCKILFHSLKQRGYSMTEMRAAKKHVWLNYKEEAPPSKGKAKDSNTRIIPIINEYNQVGLKLSKNFKKILSEDPIFKSFKIIEAYRNPTNLRKRLVRAKL